MSETMENNEELEKQISNVDFINEAEKEALNAHFTQKKEQVDIEEEAKSYLLFLASGAEQYSNHPIAKSIQTAYGKIDTLDADAYAKAVEANTKWYENVGFIMSEKLRLDVAVFESKNGIEKIDIVAENSLILLFYVV